MGAVDYYRRARMSYGAAPTADLSWRGIGPLNVTTPDSTTSVFTQAPASPQTRPITAHLDALFTSSAQAAVDPTIGEGLTLENSVKDSGGNVTHTKSQIAYKLILRVRGGETFPQWTASDATHPVDVWVSQTGGGTLSSPTAGTDLPMPWNAAASASDIPGAVAASNWLWWYQDLFGKFATYLAGTCPLASDGHNRAAHFHWIPATGPSTYEPSLQITSSISDSTAYSAITGNTSAITGAANVKAAWEAAFEQCIDWTMANFPAILPVGFQGGNMTWDSGAASTRSQFAIVDHCVAQGYGRRLVCHRTDMRYSYFQTDGFGGGINSSTSPWSWFRYCYGQGTSIACQTAGDSGVLSGSTASTDTTEAQAYITLLEALGSDSAAQVIDAAATSIAPLSEWQSVETSSSMTEPRASTGTWLQGLHVVTSAVGGWSGGDYAVAEYLLSATGNLQGRL